MLSSGMGTAKPLRKQMKLVREVSLKPGETVTMFYSPGTVWSFTRLLFTTYYTQPCMDTETTCMVLFFHHPIQRHNNKARSTQPFQNSQVDPVNKRVSAPTRSPGPEQSQ